MPPNDYEWQKTVADKWVKNGRRGVLKAVPGAGKTRAGMNIVKAVIEGLNEPKIAVLAPTTQIMSQWAEAFKEIGWEDDNERLFIRTYFWGAKLAQTPHDEFDLVIYDECHSLLSDVRGKALNIKKKAYFGLSATPMGSPQILGPVFLTVDWDEANIAPFKIKYVKFDLRPEQAGHYRVMTNDVKNAWIAKDEGRIREDDLMRIIMQRRNFVYTLPERINIVVQLVKEHPDDRIIVFAERLEQVRKIVARLFDKGIVAATYTSEEDTLDLYKEKRVRVLVTSKMVKEGFNDPSTTIGVVASTPLTERNQVQTVGRIIRYFPDKVAVIYIVLASGTSDDKLVKDGMPGEIIDVWQGLAIDPSNDYFLKLLKVEV